MVLPRPPPETTAQYQARLAAEQVEQQRKATALELRKGYCSLRSICSKYAQVRQACATAGNYNNCVSIKMDADQWRVGSCSNDGDVVVLGPKDDMPSGLECFFMSLSR
jgi:hypothetical protein